jgi:CubicO group peptidase (beta-lactamase class C family)
MTNKSALTAALIGGIFLHAIAAAAELDDPAAIDRYLASKLAESQIPGLVALVVDEDEVLFVGAHGQRDIAQGLPMTDDTIFRIASMTKPIAATAIMLLVEAGKLSLDDPISDYLPEYAGVGVIQNFDPDDGSFTTKPPNRPITIRQLLSHSSGLAYSFASNTVTALNSNGVNGIAVPSEKNSRVTTTHQRNDAGGFSETPNPSEIRSAVSGDGGLNSTVADYAKFIQLILNDGMTPDGQRLLRSETVAELGRNQLGNVRVALQDEPVPFLARAFPLGADRDGFGLGFQVTGEHNDRNARAPGSMSWAGIYNTEFWIDPANGIGGILMLQYLPFYDPVSIELLQGFEAAVYSGLR